MSWEESVQGVSDQGGMCPWGKCPGGTCPGGFCPVTIMVTRPTSS